MNNSFKSLSIYKFLFSIIAVVLFIITACVPPSTNGDDENNAKEQAYLDSLRKVRCPRLMSSAAEYYKNRDWESAVRVYNEIADLGCDKGEEEQVYPYWAVAYENLGHFDSSESVLLKGLKKLPDNINLRKRLAYAYKRQGNIQKELNEYERIVDYDPNDVESMVSLSNLYAKVERYEDQIDVIKKILELEPNNREVQSDLAIAYEKTGKDPLDIYRKKYENNPEDFSVGLDLAEKLMSNDEYDEAISILAQMLNIDAGNGSISKKLVLKKLALAYNKVDNLTKASDTYEKLFEYDKRDFRTSLEIVKINLDIPDFNKALIWVEKSISIAPGNGEIYAVKGDVYYKAFQECRKDNPSIDDKIVAALAHKYYLKAESNNYFTKKSTREWLEEYDLIFAKSDWFMLDEEKKQTGEIKPNNSCYEWIKESIKKQAGWK